MEYIALREIENMTRKQLKQAVRDCFDYAPDASPIDRLAILQEAQFYARELERRSDSWVSFRDFVLEIVVIGLIGWEIHMNYRAEKMQSEAFDKQQVVLETQKSSDATASILGSLKSTTEIRIRLSKTRRI